MLVGLGRIIEPLNFTRDSLGKLSRRFRLGFE